MALEGRPNAQFLLRQLGELVAESILDDSAPNRVRAIAQLLSDPFSVGTTDHFSLRFGVHKTKTPLISLDSFRRTSRGIVSDVAKWSVKSSAVFDGALNDLEDLTVTEDVRFSFELSRRFGGRMVKQLSSSHAFDKGNSRDVDLLEATRDRLMEELTPNDYFFGIIGKGKYTEIESRGSYYVQAADIAAGIASDIYILENLIGVVKRFEYVTFNGRRVSQADAEEETRKTLD
jgi:hypothetical protein